MALNLIFDISQEMMRGGEEVRQVTGDYQGIIRTDGRHATVGHASGQVFHARLVGPGSDLEASFIVKRADFRGSEGIWVRT